MDSPPGEGPKESGKREPSPSVSGAAPRWIPGVFVCFVVGMLAFVVVLVELPATPPPPPCGLDCGMMFAWGSPMNDTGATPPIGCPSEITGRYCYSIEIAGSGGSLQTSEMNFSLRSSVGAAVPWPTGANPDVIWLVSPSNGYPVVATFDTTTFSWTLLGNFTGALGGGYTVVVITGGTGASYGLLGDELEAHIQGVNGSATIPSNSFP